jgi:hypothetical protein
MGGESESRGRNQMPGEFSSRGTRLDGYVADIIDAFEEPNLIAADKYIAKHLEVSLFMSSNGMLPRAPEPLIVLISSKQTDQTPEVSSWKSHTI